MSSSEKHAYEFGRFRLDPSEHALLRDGSPVPLRPKVFDTLLVLVENHGRLVGKDELMRAVWPEQFVEEGNLNKTISMLRQALGESHTEQRYIETVPKRGYRFAAEVRTVNGAGVGARESEPTKRTSQWLPYLAAAMLIVTLAAIGYTRYSEAARAEAVDSVAVMPFVYDTRDPQAAYLAEGITESLINTLSQLGTVKVMSRNTVFRFKGKALDARQIARALHVRSVLMGNLKQVDGQLAVHVELIDGRDGSIIWTGQYVRKMVDVLALQTSVAQDIAENLYVKLSGAQQQQLARRYTDNVEAYELYLKGRYLWNRNKRTAHDLQKSREYFQRAIDLDPNFGLAYVGLADCYNMETLYSEIPAAESVPKAKAAVLKALQLDDTLSEAHTTLAWIKLAYEWDLAAAERELRRAIQLNPNHALAHNYYGAVLAAQGRFSEGVGKKKTALELDPLSPPIRASLAWILYFARQYDAAIKECREVLALEEDFHRAYLYLGLSYAQKEMYPQALAELRKALSLAGGSMETLSAMAYVHAASGNTAEAEQIAETLNAWSKERDVDPYMVALAYVALGQRDEAFAWLERALKARSVQLVWVNIEPRLDGIRSDPRYHDLVHRVGLSAESSHL